MSAYAITQSTTTWPLLFLMVESSDHVTPLTGASPTVTLSKNGGAFGAASGSVTEIANGWYKVAGNATDTGTLGPLVLHATAASGDPADFIFEVVAYAPQSTGFGLVNVSANVAQIAGSAVSTTSAQIGVNVVNVNGQTATAAAGVTFPASIASPTNITAGTITTVTNLTNAPTAGDLTATMKTSINASTIATVTNLTNAPTAGDFTSTMKTSLNAATPASVTGAVGSVTGAVGSVTAAVAVAGTSTLTEAYAAPTAGLTLASALYTLVQQLGRMSITGTTLTTLKRDGVTTANTFTLDSATTPTKITQAS